MISCGLISYVFDITQSPVISITKRLISIGPISYRLITYRASIDIIVRSFDIMPFDIIPSGIDIIRSDINGLRMISDVFDIIRYDIMR